MLVLLVFLCFPSVAYADSSGGKANIWGYAPPSTTSGLGAAALALGAIAFVLVLSTIATRKREPKEYDS